jgi:hypothetical protein
MSPSALGIPAVFNDWNGLNSLNELTVPNVQKVQVVQAVGQRLSTPDKGRHLPFRLL